MTNDETKDRAEIRIFPPGVPLATIVVGVGLQRIFPIDFSLSTPGRYWVGGSIVLGSMLLLGLWSVLLFRRSGQSPNPFKSTPQIVDSGPYRFTRNPMYLQMVLSCIGISIILSNLWILALTPVCSFLLQTLVIVYEEAYLEGKFGEAYLGYKQRVRRWI